MSKCSWCLMTGDPCTHGKAAALLASKAWAQEAWVAMGSLARTGLEFISDDLIDMVGLPDPDSDQNRSNAVGAIFSAAATYGVIERIGFTKSRRRISHSRIVALWIGTGKLPDKKMPDAARD